jgi:hypothetical protein
MTIRYTFVFDEESRLELAVEEGSDPSIEIPGESVPEWIELEAFRCERCSLLPGSRRTCPAALAIRPVVEALEAHISFETVETIVERDGVTLRATVSLQQAARSLIGLLLPFSSCPVMRKLRPMAYFHLPLGDRLNTAFRFLGMYLIAQHVKQRDGRAPDWELRGLLGLLDDVHMVNRLLSRRIRAASRKDASINALVGLDVFANNVEWSIEDRLQELRPFFATLLEE